ncbi:MAG: hypothetical protein LC754_15810 [Acidobacteria bacterium]|nr:hypothetical protein [Acidobacteriota bacterium]
MGGIIFHQRRAPLNVLRSWLNNGLFATPDIELHAPVIEFIDRYFQREDDSLATVVRWIVEWNERCEPYAHLSWNVESLDAETLARATQLIGHPRSVAECAAVLSQVARDINHNGATPQITWDNLTDGQHKEQLVRLSERYGYSSP